MRKLTAIITAAILFAAPCVHAWEGEEEYNSRKYMVTDSELNAYVKEDVSKSPYFGARLEPKGVYFGTLAEHDEGFPSDYSTCLTYVEFDNMQPDIYYPANAAIRNSNVNVMLAWNVANASTIRNIDDYTDYIESTLRNFAAYGKNFYIRFAGEMNDTELGSGEEYKYAFRKVADMVHRYDNMAMVWCPIAVGSLIKPFDEYYPGDEYVDWIGLSSYQIKYFTDDMNANDETKRVFMTDQYAWQTNSVKPMMKFLKDYGIKKPIMISEGGISNETVHGDDLNSWASLRMRNMYWDLIMEHPEIKMINYFNARLSWETEFFNIGSKPDLAAIIREATSDGAYIKRNSDASVTYSRVQDSATIVGPEIDFYSHAYVMGADYLKVEYYVDGTFKGSSNYSPYTTPIDVSALPDGSHTLEVRSVSGDNIALSKSYTFSKLGAFARFGAGKIVETKPINVFLNSKQISFDVQPCVIADRTLVPIRAFCNAIGISDNGIDYNHSERSVTIKNGSYSIKLYIDNPIAYAYGNEVEIDVPPTVIDGRTLVPVRFINENLGTSVSYDYSGDTLNVYLSSN